MIVLGMKPSPHGRPDAMDQPAFVNGGEDLEVKLKDYLDGATVLFDAAGNVVDGRLQGDSSPWVISPRGVYLERPVQ